MKMPTMHRIALLFNGNKVYDRQIIEGVAAYLGTTRTSWDLYLEDDFRCRLQDIENWQGDGIIADFDDPEISAALVNCRLPVVAVGGSYDNPEHYPANRPYVATDNAALVQRAYLHLIESGLENFAFFSLPESNANRWAQEREIAYARLIARDQMALHIFRGQTTNAASWSDAVAQSVEWLHALPKPVGIIAVNDARARLLLQACTTAGIAVPEQVALIGIDNDPLTRTLTRMPLSSIIQGTQEMGRVAAQLLHKMLSGAPVSAPRILVPPCGVNAQASTRFEALHDPDLMRARHFIRQYACQGIKTDQVVDYVGISRSSLEAGFRCELGSSVHGEILNYKLAAAKDMLARDQGSIADIAVRCGFTTVQYMHAVFKRELGCTPRVFQDRLKAHIRERVAALLLVGVAALHDFIAGPGEFMQGSLSMTFT